MPELALTLSSGYFVLAFGIRTLIQLRTTGRSGFVGLRNPTGPHDLVAGLVLVAALVGAAAPALAALGVDRPSVLP